jgi:hypothetical protein
MALRSGQRWVSLSEPPLALRWALPWVKHLVMSSVQRLVPQSGWLMELQMALCLEQQ